MPQLDYLGLKENPFKNNTDHRFFYADQNRAQILESTEHLIEYSTNLQVILGGEGMGKSHLLDTLTSRQDNNWRVAIIKDTDQHDTLSLIQAILDAFGASPDADMELLEALENQLAEILQLGFKPVLFIDDAQALSTEAIRFLIQLSQQKQNDEPYVSIVLLATIDITEHLQSPELKDYREVIHIATLSNLDKEGVSGYLRHKLAVAGFDRESPFTPRIIDSIYNDSNGIPEKVNFYANKFLVSSGKGDDYVDSGPDPEPVAVTGSNSPEQTDFISALKDEDLKMDRTDRAEDQISRLAEQFDEIEKMTDKRVDDFFIDKDTMDDIEDDDEVFVDNENRSGLSKFIIPVSVVGVILAAVVVLNTVFDQPEQTTEQAANNNIELLPLELPAEKSLQREKSLQPEKNLQQDKNLHPQNNPQSITNSQPEKNLDRLKTSEALASKPAVQADQLVQFKEEEKTTPTEAEVQLSNPSGSQPIVKIEPQYTQTVTENPSGQNEEKISEPTTGTGDSSKPAKPEISPQEPRTQQVVASVPELKMVDPEPVIGSNRRQTLTVAGKNLAKDTSLVVSWDNNNKEFSQKKTPEQWNYVNSNKIQLKLTTGIEAQKWQVYAKNSSDQKSNIISFDVVRPFIEDLAIKNISPNPVPGSDKRQAISIKGQGFNQQTVIELKWDKNSKHFSSRLSPNQFEFISANEIKLFITTGTQERKWKVIAKKPNSNTASVAAFMVKTESAKVASKQTVLHDVSWIKQQADDHYTVQLFGSHNKSAIDELIKKYNLQGELSRFETARNGQPWYSMTYGNFKSKQAADKAINSLDSKLTNPKPWIRSFESIKNQLSVTAAPEKTVIEKTTSLRQAAPVVKNEAWIWTQNPTDYTLQLLALSSEQAVRDYARKHQIEAQSVHFKFIRNGKPLYALIYGNYPDKPAAENARQLMVEKIKGSKPWIRSFSEVHNLITP